MRRRRSPRIVNDAVNGDSGGGELLGQPLARIVCAHDADERGAAAERRDVIGDVGGAAEPHVLGLELHHRHRRLRRDSGHPPDDEAIEHDVAGHEHGLSGEARDELARAHGIESRQRGQ